MQRTDSGKNFVRYTIGDLTVIALCDGYIDLPVTRLRLGGDRPLEPDLLAKVDVVGGKLRLSVNAFLVIDHDECVLIDTGAADFLGPTMGSLLSALEEAGVERERIGTVALTHTHEDHAHGLIAPGGREAFPNLERLLVPKNELPLFDQFERLAGLRPFRTAVEDGCKISAHITATEAHGHEVGHTAYEVASLTEKLLVWGDVVHVQSIQFDHPEVAWELDANQDEARATRREMYRRAKEPNVFVAGAHLAFPGVGKVSESEGAFRFASL